ncbi:hypothetical protein K488DRAFT_55318, partial [Vararia minispora EC-137]
GYVAVAMSLASNVFATSVIGYKAWKLVRKNLSNGSKRLITEKILSIFIESGAFYICIWVRMESTS